MTVAYYDVQLVMALSYLSKGPIHAWGWMSLTLKNTLAYHDEGLKRA
jgi:hypothetical protein